MSDSTRIEWTDATWNLVRGCTPVSPGCANCYARRFAERFRGVAGHPYEQGFDLRLVPEKLNEPLRWRKPRRVFVNSMSDLFHKKVPFEFIALVFQKMAMCPRHQFQILTKRPERMVRWFAEWWDPARVNNFVRGGRRYRRPRLYLRRPGCRECGYHFLSCVQGRRRWKDEPIMPNWRASGHLDFFGHPDSICDAFTWARCAHAHGVAVEMNTGEISVREEDLIGPFPSALKNVWLGVSVEDRQTAAARIPLLLECPAAVRFISFEPLLEDVGRIPLRGIHWVIVGGESGPGARWMHPDWVRNILAQCRRAGVPFFFKQWGGVRKHETGRVLNGQVYNEFPPEIARQGGHIA